MLPPAHSGLRHYRCGLPRIWYMKRLVASASPFPRVVGAGEAKPSTPQVPPSRPWYKQHSFYRKFVNILLVASFCNSAVMILSYKSQEREIESQSKQRIQSLREIIEKVRKGEPINIREALGTGNPDMEKSWEDAIREIEEEELHWQEKGELPPSEDDPAKP